MKEIKFNVVWSGEVAGDCTQRFNVDFSEGLTVRQLVSYILHRRKSEWGSLAILCKYSPIGFISCNQIFLKYENGRKTHIDPEIYSIISELKIFKLSGSGGYSAMDYYLTFYPADEDIVRDIVLKVREDTLEAHKNHKKEFPTLHRN